MVRTAVGSTALEPFSTSDSTTASATWGIPGPTFLAGFTIAAILVLGGTALALGVIPHLRLGDAEVLRTDPSPVDLAMASGGAALALTVALSDLRQRKLLGSDGLPRRRSTALTSSPTGLARTVHEAVGRGVRPRARDLGRDPAVAADLDSIAASVRAQGLVLGAGQRRAMRWCLVAPAVLITVGTARLVAGVSGHKPVGGLAFLLVAAAAGAAGLTRAALRSRLSPDGRSLLVRLRGVHKHLAPQLRPSWTTYGPESLLLGTALFGGVALFSADPVFAESIGARAAAAGGPGLSGSAFGGGGSGSSCGGGSGCGGGSSCGGGGCGGGCGG